MRIRSSVRGCGAISARACSIRIRGAGEIEEDVATTAAGVRNTVTAGDTVVAKAATHRVVTVMRLRDALN
jgi:hypothetical protein